MPPDSEPALTPKWMVWAGYVVSALTVLVFIMSGVMKLVQPEDMIKSFAQLGWPESLALGLGIVEIACAIVYVIPRTSALGAILLTGYLGGAIATHVRLFEPFYSPIVLGVLVWGGLWLRDERLRALLPLRR